MCSSNILNELSALRRLLKSRQRQLRLGGIVHKRHHLEVRMMRHRIKLMCMTLSATQRKPQPCGGRRIHPIHNRMKTKLQRINAAFFIDHGVAMKTSGDPLRARGVGQHVAGELFDGELIKWQVAVNRLDHPITPRPDGARAILFIAVGIRVAREVQPRHRPALAEMRASQQTIDESLVRVGFVVREKRLHLRRRRRQPDEIQ